MFQYVLTFQTSVLFLKENAQKNYSLVELLETYTSTIRFQRIAHLLLQSIPVPVSSALFCKRKSSPTFLQYKDDLLNKELQYSCTVVAIYKNTHAVSTQSIPVSTLQRCVQYPSRASQFLSYKG